MSIVISSETKDLSPWISALKENLPEEEIITDKEITNPDEVVTAVVWNHRKDLFKEIPNVQHIASLGAGVDHILNDPFLPQDAFITRVISEHLTIPMSNYCIGAILFFQRKFDKYNQDKKNKIWDQEFNPERPKHVGIMGVGELGGDLASKLISLGFDVSGYSMTRKSIPGMKSFVENELDDFLESVNILVCMLPATSETKGILSKSLFHKLNEGSYLINVARGFHQVDEDIWEALNSGKLAGAFLDVFSEEPLPVDSKLWDHPNAYITPHIAVVTKIEAAIPRIAENHHRILSGMEPDSFVDKTKGY